MVPIKEASLDRGAKSMPVKGNGAAGKARAGVNWGMDYTYYQNGRG